MGKRKLRFDLRKNYERKKTKSRTICSPESSHSAVVAYDAASTCSVPRPEDGVDVDTNSLIVSLSLSLFTSSPALNLIHLTQRCGSCQLIEWKISSWQTEDQLHAISFSKICINSHPPFTVTISDDFMWSFFIGSISINLQKCTCNNLRGLLSTRINCVDLVVKLLTCLEIKSICLGNPDDKFIETKNRHNGVFKNRSGVVVASFDDSLPVHTIRHINCEILVDGVDRCKSCEEYRSTLHAYVAKERDYHSKSSLTSSSSHINNRYLSTAELLQRMSTIRRANKALKLKIKLLKEKIAKSFDDQGVILDEDTSADMCQIMTEEETQLTSSLSPDESFKCLFWEHQKEVLKCKSNGKRWHPLIIRWCLYLRHQSSKAYETLRNSGIIQLPSQRTLRDYSHCVKAHGGYSTEEDRQLMRAVGMESCPDWHKLIVLLIDEIHIRESVVYNKHSGKMIGFVDLGQINNHLLAFERSVEKGNDAVPSLANSMLVMMVRGLFTPLRFPYVQFPCSNISGELLFQPFWEAIYRLERIGLKVLAVTFDGASVNRRLLAIHDTSQKDLHKIVNIHSVEGRHIYFFSDPPHLIKTTRNCWASKSRDLWVNGKRILWQHLRNLYERDQGKGSGLSMIPKLKFEHLNLSSFSKMRVDLAAQVLSSTVSKALQLTGGPEVEETAKFALMFNNFFDTLNVSNFTNGTRSRNPFNHPYRHKDDFRLDWLKNVFLPYLDNWEASVNAREGFSVFQKRRMTLSTETLLGLRMTAQSFIEFVPFLFSLPEVKENRLAFLSNHLCQDALENHFGCHRQRGGTNDNPTAQEYFNNTETLRVVDNFCRGPVRGNCRGQSEAVSVEDCAPLMKRRRKSTN